MGGRAGGTAAKGHGLDRVDARSADMERRLRPRRHAMFAVLTAATVACGPWIGWWELLPLALAVVVPGLLQTRLRRSANPARWDAAVWLIGPVMIATTVALTGGPRSPALIWFVLPAVTLRIRGDGRRLEVGLGVLLLLMLASTLGSDPAAFADAPTQTVFTAALLVATTFLIGAITDAEHEFRRAAGIDPLTGLPNRLTLASDLEALATRAPAGPVAMLAGDLVSFKHVNDQLGHTVGDSLLCAVADVLHRSLRPQDRVYRIGGDEFLAVLPATTDEEARVIARRLETEVASATEHDTPVAIRFGIAATGIVGIVTDFDELYAHADRALIRGKQHAPAIS